MQPTAIRIIREEHTAIACVIHSLEYVVDKLEEGGEPNFSLLQSIMEYIVEYPERYHHPKENRYLFETLRQRNPNAATLIAELEAEHVRGDELLKDLKRSLARYETHGRSELRTFARAVATFAEYHWQHMTKEEDILLPIARKSLTESDWHAIAEAFLQNDNPLIGFSPKQHYSQLFDRILKLASRPIVSTEGSDQIRDDR